MMNIKLFKTMRMVREEQECSRRAGGNRCYQIPRRPKNQVIQNKQRLTSKRGRQENGCHDTIRMAVVTP